MFKKLRNNFLTVSCLTIASLILCCFAINYLMVYQGMRGATERKLKTEINMTERRINPPNTPNPPEGANPSDGAIKNPHNGPPKERHENEAMTGDIYDFGKNQSFSPTFSVVTDENGTVSEVNMAFSMSENFYSDKAAEIISSGKSSGRIHGENTDGSASSWRYLLKKIDGGYIIAFTEISSDIYILKMFALCLLLIALAAIIVTVFISLFFANSSIRPIEEAYNKQKQFIADASHELKTPLSAINTNIDVLLSQTDADDDERKWLFYIKDEAWRMSKLTNDLLYLARADYGAEARVYGRVSWTDIVKNALLIMEARAFEQNVTLNSRIADNIFVAADAEQLKQLVMILLDNAVKYTPSGGSIEMDLQKRNSDAYLIVKNTGSGISDVDLPHIFDRFYRSDKARTYTENSGYGLGLAIAKTIAESFKGTITAESHPDSYTVFTVKLPALK